MSAAQVRPRRRPVLGVLLLAAGLAFGSGFVWFAHDALQPPGKPGQADGIVALTGGSGRIEVALSLLASGHAGRLLISGVNPSLDLARLAYASGLHVPAGVASGAISLGHAATTTTGNAEEAAAWARANKLHSLIVVTAGYHMRRALIEIGAALPGVRLAADPVLPPALLRPASFGTLRLLLTEYLKWLAVEIGHAATHPREIV
ncbi:YdcF family protein [Lichenicoccus sp.]|uniref:YdcF family protein n=1 Tax=Lichenicoccus sp. TaxID=2781899 RepID=UPI003D0C0AB7